MSSPESRFVEIDDLISEATSVPNKEEPSNHIDELMAEAVGGLQEKSKEVKEWPLEKKRKEAVDSSDQFVLSQLMMDEDHTIRTLAACNLHTPADSLLRAVVNDSDYIRMVIANNPNVTTEILERIFDLTAEPEVLKAIKQSPKVSPVTKFKIENKM